jgi:hypothetical protein
MADDRVRAMTLTCCVTETGLAIVAATRHHDVHRDSKASAPLSAIVNQLSVLDRHHVEHGGCDREAGKSNEYDSNDGVPDE